uniref:Uncharacterized protein n=1 Tax=Setaria digitata TaxID=48799 RepID=A0A915PG11_9BILA
MDLSNDWKEPDDEWPKSDQERAGQEQLTLRPGRVQYRQMVSFCLNSANDST